MSSAGGALANIKSPEVVLSVHENHIKAGCEIITTNTFSTCRHALDAIGLGDQTEKINSEGVRLARKAIENVDADYLKTHGTIVIERLALSIARLAILLEVELSE